MRKYEPYNPQSEPPKDTILVTNRLFVISLTIYAFVAIFVAFQDDFGLQRWIVQTFVLVLISVAFLMNVFGFVKGMRERKLNPEMAANGIIGNLLFVIIILVLLGIGAYYLYQLGSMDLSSIQLPLPRKSTP